MIPAKVQPFKNENTYASNILFENRNPAITITRSTETPTKTGFLPTQKSARGGIISIVVTYPMKNMEPIRPTSFLETQSKSNLSGLTQLSIYSSSSTGLQ